MQAVVLGTITGVGGGTLRDVLTQRVPVVLRSELYAIPALAAATVVVAGRQVRVDGVPVLLGGAAVCFTVRLLGVRYDLNAPGPPADGGP